MYEKALMTFTLFAIVCYFVSIISTGFAYTKTVDRVMLYSLVAGLFSLTVALSLGLYMALMK